MGARYLTVIWICTGIILAVLTSCEETPPDSNPGPSTSINKIMPLGASRVQGARPFFESYRYELWKDLVEGGWTFDYIGTMDDAADYPDFMAMEFDTDHEGRGGWTSGQILGGLPEWLEQTGSPDIVLFSSPGGNDALQGKSYDQAIENINDIIDTLQADNPGVTILIEAMAPGASWFMTEELTMFFTRIQQDVDSIAIAQTTESSRVIAIDMYSGFSDSFLADAVHYNQAGAEFIATRYYTALTGILESGEED